MPRKTLIKSKSSLSLGLKYLVGSLPLLFLSPILIVLGLKSPGESRLYVLLIIGLLLAIVATLTLIQAIRLILKSMFVHEN